MQFMNYLVAWLLVRIRSERGQDLIEYAMLSGLIALAIIAVGGLLLFQTSVEDMVKGIGGCIDFKKGGCDPF